MTVTTTAYLDYTITVTEDSGRYTPRVHREGGLIEHDGRSSEVWSAPSYYSLDRALQMAKTAIDSDKIR
jgi:hypothetical protein